MAKIPTRTRQVIPSGSVAGAFIPSDIADVGQGLEARGLAAIGRGVGDIGSVIAELAIRDRQASDLKQASVDAADRKASQLAVEEWKNQNTLDTHTAENFGRVWDENTNFDPSAYLSDSAREQAQITQTAERDHFIRSSAIIATDTRIKDTILSTKDAYLLEPNEANRDNYKEALGLMHTDDRVDGLIAAADAEIKEILEGQGIDIVVTNAIAFTVQDGVAQGLPDTEAGLKAIRESGLSPSNQVKANTTYNALVKQQRDAIEVQREADRDTLNTALAEDKLTPAMINNTSLSETEQLSYDKLYRSWAKDGPKIITDEQVRADLRRSVINIGRGANTKTQVMALLNEARFGDDPTIDDAAYKELSALAETTLNKVQGDFLTEAHRDGQEQLVDFTKEEFIVLAAEGRLTESQLQRRKAQLWWADRFDNEMELWIQNNPDKNKREGYQQEQMVLASYINTSHADIEALRTRTLFSFQQQDARRREGKAVPLTEAELQGGMTDLVAAEKQRTIKKGEAIAAKFLAEHPLESIEATAKPFKAKPKVTMQGPSGGTAQIKLSGISVKLDQGFRFPVGSNVMVKRNPTDNDVEFEGLTIKPDGRVISLDGGETWQLLP